jgi:ABC-type transport system involved in multi-copper enzyme maturation permease subunit
MLFDLKKNILVENYKLIKLGFVKSFILKTSITALLINSLILIFQNIFAEGASKVYFDVFNFFSRYAYGPFLLLMVTTYTGKEYDWGTINHLVLKGQRPLEFVLTKWLLFNFWGLLTYLIISTVIIVIFLIYSMGNYVATPFTSISYNFYYILMYVSFGILMGVLAQSSTRAIIYSLIYIFICEMVLFNLFGWVALKLNLSLIDTIFDHTPYSVLLGFLGAPIVTGKYFFYVGFNIFYYIIFIIGSWYLLKKRELIRAHS